jgi:hypothetical protein
MVCAATERLIVGYRYARPATAADQQAARAAGYDAMETRNLCQAAWDALPADERATYERIAPPVDPLKLALAAFVASLALGLAGGVLSTARFLDGSSNGAPPLEALPDYAELPPLSPAEALVALVFRPPR